MRTTEHIECFRITNGRDTRFNTDSSYGMNGAFQIRYAKDNAIEFFVIVSDGSGMVDNVPWEHVSARARRVNGAGRAYERVPSWEEMCWLKELFWRDDEVAVQYHPKKSDYVNLHPHVLHLWRFTGGDMPTPPVICV